MRTIIQIFAIVAFFMIATLKTNAQQWNTAGNTIFGTEWFGADAASTIPLDIRHRANQPMFFSTNNIERMRIAEFGNVSVGGDISPNQKFAVMLHNNNAAPAPNFESTAIFAFNRFQSEGAIINRGIRATSPVTNFGGDDFNGVNLAGSFWASRANTNIGIFVNVSWSENLDNPVGIPGTQGWGVQATARDHETLNVAVSGRARAHASNPNAWTVSIHGEVEQIVSTNSFAGWFDGDIMYNGQILNPSDQSLKENVEEVEGALDIINQLQPKTFNYLTEGLEFMGLPDGTQYGVIAQEMAEVLPNLTRDASRPAIVDSAGNEVTPAIDFKAVNYTGLIPILLAGMQEQQSIINAQNEALSNVMDQLDDLQQQINNCCAGGDSGYKNNSPGENTEEQNIQKASPKRNVLGQNSPNPFRSQTTISYTLEQGGKVLLNVYDRNGKVVANLEEAEQAADTYRYEWDASGLPAGLYHYALYVDGELLVKKAIKLND